MQHIKRTMKRILKTKGMMALLLIAISFCMSISNISTSSSNNEINVLETNAPIKKEAEELATYTVGDAIYLDINGIEAWTDCYHYGVFWHGEHYGSQYTYGHPVSCHGGSTTIYEFQVPLLSYGNEPPYLAQFMAFGYDERGEYIKHRTDDLAPDENNVYVLNGETGGGHYLGSWDDEIIESERISYFTTLFNECVQCDGLGGMTVNRWEEPEAEFSHIASNIKNTIRNTSADPSGTQLQFALSKYDFIVFQKQYYSDYMDRASSPYVTQYAPNGFSQFERESGFKTEVVLVYVVASLGVLGLFFFISYRVKKSKKKQHQ